MTTFFFVFAGMTDSRRSYNCDVRTLQTLQDKQANNRRRYFSNLSPYKVDIPSDLNSFFLVPVPENAWFIYQQIGWLDYLIFSSSLCLCFGVIVTLVGARMYSLEAFLWHWRGGNIFLRYFMLYWLAIYTIN